MIGPRGMVGPLVHSHDGLRGPKRRMDRGPSMAHHPLHRRRNDPIRPPGLSRLVHGPGCRPWPTRRGHDRGPGRRGHDGLDWVHGRCRPPCPIGPSGRRQRGAEPSSDSVPLSYATMPGPFYSSCRFLVDGVVVTNGNDDDHHSNSEHSRHRRACSPLPNTSSMPSLVPSSLFIRSSASRYRAKSSSASVSRR